MVTPIPIRHLDGGRLLVPAFLILFSGSACSGTTGEPQVSEPTLTSILPTEVMAGSTTRVVLQGSHFNVGDPAVHVSGEGINSNTLTVVSASRLEVDLIAAQSAATGGRTIYVETRGGVTDALPFDVVANPAPTSIRVVSGGPATGVVHTLLPDPLVVEVTNFYGDPVPDVSVEFIRVSPDLDEPWAGVGEIGTIEFDPVVISKTDVSGRARVGVALGNLTGTAWVWARVAATPSVVDSVLYTMQPAPAYRVSMTSADTALTLGSSSHFDAKVFDIYGNLRSDEPTIAATAGSLVEGSEGVITGEAYGTGAVIASHGEFRDTVIVAVVPPAELLVYQRSLSSERAPRLVLMRSDLSDKRIFADQVAAGAKWMPDGTRAVLHHPSHDALLMFADGVDVLAPVIAEPVTLASQEWPTPSSDGEWIYFLGLIGDQSYEIWRVHPDGTAAEQVTKSTDYFDQDLHPSTSPDGQRLAYWTSRAPNGLVVQDLATGIVTPLAVSEARFSRWSPRGDWIAFHETGLLQVIRPDGTARDTVGTDAGGYSGMLGWSPDGTWLVVRGVDGLEFVNVDTALRIPLPSSWDYDAPSWRPAVP